MHAVRIPVLVTRVPWFRVSAALALVFLLHTYWAGAVLHLHQVNRVSKGATDQRAYLVYAQKMAESNYAYVGGRNRMPVFPSLLSLVYRPGISMPAFFVRAKYMNIALSIVLLPLIWLIARSVLPVLESTTLTLIGAFTVYVYKAAYAQSELLFYALNFAVFAGSLHLLKRPRWGLAVAVGVLTGLAHLTKASVLPMLCIWLAWVLIATAAAYLGRRHVNRATHDGSRDWARRAGVGIITPAVFLIVIFPYIHTSRQVFGHWFYNVNSTFYIWYDSFRDAMTGTRAHGDREHWPTMPAEEIPSPRRYFREHSAAQAWLRLRRGFRVQYSYLKLPFAFGRFLEVYAIICALVVARWSRKSGHVLLADGRWVLTGFALSVFAAYAILCAFYTPIAYGPRFMLAQFLPVMFCLLAFLSREPLRDIALAPRSPIKLRHVHLVVLTLLAHHILFEFPLIIGRLYAGQ